MSIGHRIWSLASGLLIALNVAAQPTLTLEQFLATVEASHPSLRAAQYEPELAEAEIRGALGRFDPDIRVDYEYKDKDGSDKLNYLDGAVELPLDMMFGPKVKAEYRRGIGSTIDPENATAFAGEASVGVALPLFQGIFTDARRNQLRKAMVRPDVARAQYQLDRNQLLRAAAISYWDWAEAWATVRVTDSILALAEQRFTQVVSRVLAGEQPAIDSVEIAQEVLRRRGEKIRALRMAEQSEVALGVFVWTNDLAPRTIDGRPQELPMAGDPTISSQQAQQQARELRPEVRRMDAVQRTARLDSALADEYLRPFVEASAALTSYDVSSITKTDYKLGLRVSQPLFFRSASAGAQVAQIGVQRADLTRLLVERTVDADAAAAVVAVTRTQERLSLALEEVRLATAMVDAERRRFIAGESTLLNLNLRERFLAEALLRQVSAQGDLARARITLLWATGTI